MKHYDFIIAGGGAAGLSLACHLVRSPLQDRSILIIDRERKERNDRTWAFWTDRPTPFDEVVFRSWTQFQFVGEGFAKAIDLQGYRYQVIRGIDFYRYARQELAAHANVTFRQGTVTHIEDSADEARVFVDGEAMAGTWVFDSLAGLSGPRPDTARYHHLKLYFRGWEIETERPVFDPQMPTLMDFRTAQKQDTRFFYVLPFDQRRALVEHTLFTPQRASRPECEQAFQDYVETTLRVRNYRVVAEEGGCIPVTDQPYLRQSGRRVMTIGAKGGRIKPTTGYAFLRIQEDSAGIVRSLMEQGHPFAVPADSRGYRLLDSIMLAMMAGHGEQIKPIFTTLFRRNPIRRILRFLDETASPLACLALMATLPPWLFLRVAFQSGIRPALTWQPSTAGVVPRRDERSRAAHGSLAWDR